MPVTFVLRVQHLETSNEIVRVAEWLPVAWARVLSVSGPSHLAGASASECIRLART